MATYCEHSNAPVEFALKEEEQDGQTHRQKEMPPMAKSCSSIGEYDKIFHKFINNWQQDSLLSTRVN